MHARDPAAATPRCRPGELCKLSALQELGVGMALSAPLADRLTFVLGELPRGLTSISYLHFSGRDSDIGRLPSGVLPPGVVLRGRCTG